MSTISRRTFVRGGALAVAAAGASAVNAAPALAAPAANAANAANAAKPTIEAPAPKATAQALYQPPAASATNSALADATGWYVPSDWGRSWRAKLNAAAAGKALAVAALVGDSVGFGYWASNLTSTSWFEVMRSQLVATAGNGGSGFQSQARTASVMYNPLSGVPVSYKSVPGNVWQESAGWTPLTPPHVYGPGAGAMQCTKTGATLFNYIYGTQLGVWYLDNGANFTVQINGQTVGTVTVGTSGAPTRALFNVPGGKFDVHSWQITGTAGSNGGTSICGVEGLSATGVRLDNFSFPGLFSEAFNNMDSPWASGTYAGGWRNPADLIIYELGGNDIAGQDPNYPNGTPADVWVQNVETYLAGVVNNTFGGNALGNTDILFMFPVANQSVDKHVLYAEYKSRVLGLAHSYGAAVVDLNALFHGSWNAWQQAGYAGNQTDPTKSGADANHPCDAGHAFTAAVLGSLVYPLA